VGVWRRRGIDNCGVFVARQISPATEPATSKPDTRPAWAARIDQTAVGRRADVIVFVVAFSVGAAFLGWLTTLPPRVTHLSDFYHEAWPSYRVLDHGHLLGFLQTAPAYVGSLVLRAPFALVAHAWGGHARAAYFATGLPCLAAAAAFCVWLSAQPRTHGGIGWASRLTPVLLLFFNPVVLGALILGHPEEILGAVLCVAGVLLAVKGRVEWSGVLIGLAVVNKPSALVAVPVALAVMPGGRRLRGLLVMAATAGALLIPITLVRLDGFSVSGAGAQLGTGSGGYFFAPQLLWWFGPHAWIVGHAHVGIVAASIVCAAVWYALRRRGDASPVAVTDALALLTLVLLLRSALDPWDNLYYLVPFVLSLMTWEVRSGRTPIRTFFYTVLIVIVVPVAFIRMTDDTRAVLYALMVLPTMAWLAAMTYLSPAARQRVLGPRLARFGIARSS
jgi:hypothetical protein